MNLFSAEQIRLADEWTIEHEPIASIDLMERAAAGCRDWILKHFDVSHKFQIFCGTGNNGGDGLALARLLSEKKYLVSVFVVGNTASACPNFMINIKRLRDFPKVKLIEIQHEKFPDIASDRQKNIIVDALFGTGLSRTPEGIHAELIDRINLSGQRVISIDVPSGLLCDSITADTKHVVRAHDTLTFQQPKFAFLFPDNEQLVGQFHIIPIRLKQDFLKETEVKNFYIDGSFVRTIYSQRTKFAHKGTYGHALIVAGGPGKTGAAVLSVLAALRAGAGWVTAHLPAASIPLMNSSVPEALTHADESNDFITNIPSDERYNAIGVGPGIGTDPKTSSAVKMLIQNAKVPLILDADALNILSENKTWLSFLPKSSILTPHPKEFERLAGKHSDSFERHAAQKEFAIKNGVYLILKGAHTCIACPDGKAFFNSTGNPGMAKAGSGDVLTGILTALLAQGYSPVEASVFGVFLHGLAGDFAAEQNSEEAMLARDICSSLGEAFKSVRHSK